MEDAHIACLDLNSILTQGPVQDPQKSKLELELEHGGEMEKREGEIILSEINNVNNKNNNDNNIDKNDGNNDVNNKNNDNTDNSVGGSVGLRESEEQEEIRRKEFLKGIAVFGVFDGHGGEFNINKTIK